MRSVDEVLRTLVRIRDDPALRAAVARNCAERAAGVDPARMTEAWAAFLTTMAVPAYRDWRRRSLASRSTFLATRLFRYAAFVCADFVIRAVGFVRKRVRSLMP